MPSFNHIFKYVLSPIHEINMPSTIELESIARRSRRSVQEIIESKTNQIRSYKAAIQEIFAPYKKIFKFRPFLRANGANQLEDILFGDHELTLNITIKPFPLDETLDQAFTQLNQQYNYFSQKDLPSFKLLFKVCHFIAEVLENNNSTDNSVAFLHAYKLMVFFKEDNPSRLFNSIDIFIKIHALTISHYPNPIHDLLVHSIPCFVSEAPMPPKDLLQWQVIIHSGGPKAIELFQQAKDINTLLQRAPLSLREAEEAAAYISYSRAKENPKLALLCLLYHLSETTFNQCLEIEPKRKRQDNLPAIEINGESVGHPGYFLVKLPIDDPRSYILGQITNCCQSIGGHSEQCVIDGITRENCGFYVLLRGPSDNQPILQDGQINDEFYKIVGQGYTWLSNENALVFDSWENLRPDDNPVVDKMLRHFAEIITSRNDLSIPFVSIGTGGKTPESLSQNSFGENPEVINVTMKEGVQYSDSKKQWVLAFNVELFKQLKQNMVLTLQEAIAKGFFGLQSMLDCLAQNPRDIEITGILFPSELLIHQITQLFLQDDSLSFWENIVNNDFNKLSMLVIAPDNTIILCQLLILIKPLNLLNNHNALDNFKLIVDHPDKKTLLDVFLLLEQQELLIGECAANNFMASIRHQNPQDLAKGLLILQAHQALIGHEAQTNFNKLLIHENLYCLVDGLLFMQKKQLLNGNKTQGNIRSVINHKNSEALLQSLSIADKLCLLTKDQAQANFEVITNHQNPLNLTEALIIIFKLRFLFTKEQAEIYYKAIINHQDPLNLANALSCAEENSLFTTEDTQAFKNAIIKHQNPELLVSALILAHENHLLTEDQSQANQRAIFSHPNPVSMVLALLKAHDNYLLTGEQAQTNRELIVTHQNPESMVCALLIAEDNLLFIGDNACFNRETIINHDNPESMAKILLFAEEHNFFVGEHTKTNQETIVKHSNLHALLKALSISKQHHLLHGTKGKANFNCIVNHPHIESLVDNLLKSPTQETLDQKTSTIQWGLFQEQPSPKKDDSLLPKPPSTSP